MRLFIVFTATLSAAFARPCFAADLGSKPNIVVILCDDLGIGDVHAFNPRRGKIPTPSIDRMAAQGMMFTDAHTSSAVCTPSRYSILTGRYCWRSRLQAGVLGGFSEPLLARDRRTVAEFLQHQGYMTACIGKWHLGLGFGPERYASPLADGPLQHGFDHFFGISASLDMPPFAWVEDDRFPEAPTVTKQWLRSGPAAPSFEAVDVMPTLTRKAVEFIRSQSEANEAPYFLYLAFTAPHTPIVPTPEWQGRSGLGDYGDFVMQTDASVGEVLRAVDESRARDNTLVMFASDNGFAPAADAKALESQGHYPSADFRGYKSDIYEGGHRVPLIVRWPAVVAAGVTCEQQVGLIDLFATAADLLGQQLPADTAEDSVSLLPLLQGEDGPVRATAVHHSIDGCFAVREGDWKLALCAGSGGWGVPREPQAARKGLPKVQLYDMVRDRGEQNNLQAEQPQIVQRLTDYLKKSIARGRTTPGPPQTNDATIRIDKSPQPATEAAAN
ncbi:MAG: arylsulfatase [Planctomycetales bacterium]|nr:arylsulfatase [Planctomycetales bacterium]